ncbi:MAG: mechanosensitive ion channel family protein, partial [Lachnospiraceae bacterium]|nr:mechanosensitive ion channel family protein [Lachnospiraceae bacterium]
FISAPVYKGVERFEDSGIVLRFTAETRETDIFVARRALNEEILCLLQRKSVEIPFPQVVVHPAK